MNLTFIRRMIFFIVISLVAVNYAKTSHIVIIGDGGSFSFTPANLTIAAGDTVTWEWQANNHSTTSDAIVGPEVWDSGVLTNGATFSKVFTQEGVYPYHCTPHQSFGMVGTITVSAVLGIDDFSTNAVEFRLNQNSPNPFNPTTNIKFSLSHESKVNLSIYDIVGNKVKSLVNSYLSEGEYSFDWNGTNNQGIPVPSGTYIYSMVSNNQTQSIKMILLR